MNHDSAAKDQSPSWASRVLAIVMGSLFALAFGGGLYAGLLPLGHNLVMAWQVRDWQPVPAAVLAAQLDSKPGKGRSSHAVQAEYEYQYAGTTHRGHRVGLETWSQADNIGSWQSDWHGRLLRAQNSGEPITAWVNPRQPDQSVLEREIRWPLVLFRLPFAILFTGVGVVAGWMALAALLGRPGPDWRGQRRAVGRGVAAGGGLIEPERGGHRMLWVMAMAWLLISVPMAVSAWPQAGGARWMTVAFSGVGVFLSVMAWRETQRSRRFRGAHLVAEPVPLRTGQAVQFRLRLPASALSAQPHRTPMTLRLGMHLVDDSGSSRTTRLGWEQTTPFHAFPGPDGGSEVQARFELPADTWPSGAIRARERVQWLLQVLDDRQEPLTAFELQVQQGEIDEQAAARRVGALPAKAWGVEHLIDGAAAADAASRLPEGVQLREGEGGWRLVFRRRAAQTCAGLAAVGMVLLLWPRIGPALLDGLPPGTVSAVRQGWAAVLSWLVLHLATSRWTLRVADTGLQVDRGSWFLPRSQHVALGQLAGLFHKLAYTSTSSGSPSVEHHALWARTGPHGKVRLTPAMAHAASARAVAWQVQQAVDHHRGLSVPGQVRPRPGITVQQGLLCAATWAAWLLMIFLAAP